MSPIYKLTLNTIDRNRVDHYELDSPPKDAISAVKFAPSSSNRLLVSSWDRFVYLYEVDGGASSGGQLIRSYEHRAPVLSYAPGSFRPYSQVSGIKAYAWLQKCRIDLQTAAQDVLSTHDAGASRLAYSPQSHLLISASWDSTLHIHSFANAASPTPPSIATVPLPAKPFALSLSPTKLVLAMSGRNMFIYDLSALALLTSQASSLMDTGTSPSAPYPEIQPEPFQRRESSLKFMTRAVACMPSDAGFACSSIEGRVAVEWFDASAESQARKYAFKCHRQAAEADPSKLDESQQNGNLDVVYPVHALAFHPLHGTFASGGGDGVVALWDANAKRRIRQYQRYSASVAGMAFSGNGRFLAVGVCPGFEDGMSEEEVGKGPIQVFVRELGDSEAKGRAPK